jgi:D-alanine-D-alanine ligase
LSAIGFLATLVALKWREIMVSVGIVCGGQSAEHEVSLVSAKNILAAIDRKRFRPFPVGVSKSGDWYRFDDGSFLLNPDDPAAIALDLDKGTRLQWLPGDEGGWFDAGTDRKLGMDVLFPIIHGTRGEDGILQALIELAGVPYVGSGVRGSAACMDKEFTKVLARSAGVAVAPWCTLRVSDDVPSFADCAKDLGSETLFVKPANAGSSAGISKVSDASTWAEAIQTAFQFDTKILIEAGVAGREIECAVLGNHDPKASTLGEIIPRHSFYSYEAKYLDPDGAALVIPAELPAAVSKSVQELAVKTYKALDCEGLARVDFFVTKGNDVILNEVNTLPGFTPISMYPKLWAESGIAYPELIEKLINFAFERHKERSGIQLDLKI